MAQTVTELKSLCELFQRVAAANADRPALRTPGGTSAPEQVTYILGNAETNVVISETAFLERLRAAAGGAVEPIAAKYASAIDALYAE